MRWLHLNYEPHTPRWAIATAHVIPLLAVPSGLWRIALGVGIPVGFTGELAELYAAPGWITPYVIGLTILSEAAALTSFALVQRWGVVVPARVPFVGGRQLPTWLVAAVATVGVVGIGVMTATTVAFWNGPENMGDPDSPQGVAGVIMTATYVPLVAWAPLLGLLTGAYVWRRARYCTSRQI